MFNLKVTQGATATIDSGAANGATVEVAGVAGNVDVTTGAGNDTVTVAVPNQGNLEVSTGAGNDAINVNSAVQAQAPAARAAGQTLSFDGGEGADTVTFQDDANLTGWGDAIFTGIETVGYDKTFTVDANQLGGASITSGENATKLTINDNITDMLDLSGVDKGTTEVTMGKGAQVTLGDAADTIVLGSGVDTPDALNVVIGSFAAGSAAGHDNISLDGFYSDFGFGTSVDYANHASGSASDGSNAAGTGEGSNASYDWEYTVATDGGSAITLQASMNVTYQSLGSDNKIYVLDSGIVAENSAAVADIFQGSSVGVITESATAGATSAAVEFDSGDNKGLYLADGSDAIVGINNADGGTNLWYVSNGSTQGVDDLTVQLIGTLDGITNPTTLVSANFA